MARPATSSANGGSFRRGTAPGLIARPLPSWARITYAAMVGALIVWTAILIGAGTSVREQGWAVRPLLVLGGVLGAALGVAVVTLRAGRLAWERARLESLLSTRTLEFQAVQVRLSAAEREVQLLAVTDSLTGLANRRAFDQRFEQEWQRARRDRSVLTVIVLDVDRFEGFNTVYGFGAGDECLRLIGTVLRDAARRPADLAARSARDEFIVLLAETSPGGAQSVAETIRQRLGRLAIPQPVSTVAGRVTVSVGVASTIPEGGAEPASLLAVAAEALGRAQAAGGNRVASIVVRGAGWSTDAAADGAAADPLEIVALLSDAGDEAGRGHRRYHRLGLGAH